MKIFNILITILSTIVIYIIFKNYNNTKIEKFTAEAEEGKKTDKCTASLTDWEKVYTKPSGKELGKDLTDSKWESLKTKLSESNKNIVSFNFKDDLFKDMNNVEYYKIDINDYLIDKNSSTEYWKPIKKWKEGVVSHFCKELCILKLGYEWIKISSSDITKQGLNKLSDNIVDPVKINGIKELIREAFINQSSLSYSIISTNENEYAELNRQKFNDIIGSSYIYDNNYVEVDGTYYKVAANLPTGRKWKVYPSSGSYISSQIDGKLDDVTHFNNLDVDIGDIIILNESEYNSSFTNNGINLTEKYVIHPSSPNSKVFKPEIFEYDNCYNNSCAVFANKEFDDYLKLINLRESMGYKTSTFGHTTDIMTNSDNRLLNLVNQLQDKVNDRTDRGSCSYSLMIDKLIEVIKTGEYVRQDDSTSEECTKTYDPHTYVMKPTDGKNITYSGICNDLDIKKYRKKINPEIFKYITTEWINKKENENYNFEKKWDVIKEQINLTEKYGNKSLTNKVISKNQLSELILKYLDDVEYTSHEGHRKPICFSDGYCDGTGIIIKNPNTNKLMDSKNNNLDENDLIELYTDKDSYYWKEVPKDDISESSNIKTIPQKLGKILSRTTDYGITEFNKTEWSGLNISISLIRYDIYKYDTGSGIKYYQYLGLLPRYITMGIVAPGKYKEITSDNIKKVGRKPNSSNITKNECNDIVNDKINENKTNKLDKITELTNKYYENLLKNQRKNINTLHQEIDNINTNMTSTYDNLCTKYESNDYKLYSEYNLIKFIKNNTLNIINKINLNEITQKTIKLKEISSSNKNKKYDKQTGELTQQCRDNECRDLGNITGDGATILQENINEDNIIISLNDFSRIVANKVNILENDYLLINNTKRYKILEISDDNIVDKIDNDFSKESYPDIFKYTYDDFISINIDLHRINIESEYYIVVNDNTYELNMDNIFKKFITNYKSIYQQITDIDLTNTEKCINKEGENLFADSDAIIKSENSCTIDNHSCKENIFEKKYTLTQYNNMQSMQPENKNSWIDYLQDYDNIYKASTGYGVIESQMNNKQANFWKNRYHNEKKCPEYGTGKETKVNDLYNINPLYNNGLKWKKLPSDIDISGKIIIEIYDYDVLNTSLDSNEIILDFTNSQNNIRFKTTDGNIIDMSNINNNYYLMIEYIGDDGNEFTNYYEVFGTNKCSSSQICSSKSNEEYINEFNKHVGNIYNDQQYCNNLNTNYGNRYTESEKTSFEKDNKFKINNITDFESLLYYPKDYDNNYNLYEFNSIEQTSAPQVP
tara:strand:- start:2344 stop:6195 length:3852 start_codon:yes stop_codon:yes gene_type:complete